MEFAGELETHLTVALRDRESLAALRSWGEPRGWKFTHIELAQGAHPSQPMLSRRRTGTLSSELRDARATCDVLLRELGRVLRVKIEAAPDNEDVPQSHSEEQALRPDRYFEHHVKLLLDSGVDLPALSESAIAHGAHVSRNALKQRSDGKQERFVTQRCYGVGRAEAGARLETLVAALREPRYTILKAEQEFVVYDDCVALDDGWLAGKE